MESMIAWLKKDLSGSVVIWEVDKTPYENFIDCCNIFIYEIIGVLVFMWRFHEVI